MAAALISHPLGQVLPSIVPGRTSMARRMPVGVVGVICPWNFPVVLPARSVGPALALGNAVILKSDPNTPISGGVLTARHLRGGRPARGPPARDRRRRRGRPGALRGPERADDLLHRLDRHRPQGRRGRRPQPQAHRARARRQQPARGARGRRHRGRVVGRRVGLVPAPGPDLPRGEPAPRAREHRRRLREGARRAGVAPAGRQPGHRGGRARADHQREAGAAGRADRRRERLAGRRPRDRRNAREPVLPADRARRRHPLDAGLHRRDLRPGGAGDHVQGRRRGGRARERDRLRARGRGPVGLPAARVRRWPSSSAPAWST